MNVQQPQITGTVLEPPRGVAHPFQARTSSMPSWPAWCAARVCTPMGWTGTGRREMPPAAKRSSWLGEVQETSERAYSSVPVVDWSITREL